MAGVKYWLWLSEHREVSLRAKLALLEHFGSPEEAYYADEGEYLLVDGVGKAQAEALADKSLARCDRTLGDCERLGVRIVTMEDAEYPSRLRNIFEPPMLLYVRGRLPLIDEEVAVTVVGTRTATPYGLKQAEDFSFAMAKQGALIVSGGAAGIDTQAHRGALRAGGKTVAVLGCGIDVIYPQENRYLYEDIAVSGAILSEFPLGTPAAGSNFPVRNRIMSGLSLAVLVVEAPERSGALITARTALEQGRDVFAVPGALDAPMSRGCNRLIAEGAGIALSASGILSEYEAQYPHKLLLRNVEPPKTPGYLERSRKESAPPPEKPGKVLDLRSGDAGLTDDQITVVRALCGETLQVDDLIEKTGLPTRRVLSALTVLEIDGCVAQSGGKHFSLIAEVLEE